MRLGGVLVGRLLVLVSVKKLEPHARTLPCREIEVGLRLDHNDLRIFRGITIYALCGDIAERIVLFLVHLFAHIRKKLLQLFRPISLAWAL